MEDSDSDLVGRGVHGDARALHALVDRYARYLFRVAYSLTGHVADAEDLVQETFLACFAGLARFEGRSTFRTWLVSILSRQAAELRRRQGVRRTASLAATGELVAPAEREPGRGGADLRLDLGEALGHLSPEHREVLVLREYGGLSYQEIADALALPRGTVESRLHRARLELRQRMREYS